MRVRLVAAFLAVAFIVFAIQDLPLLFSLRDNQRALLTLQTERDAWRIAAQVEEALEDRAFGDLATLVSSAERETGARVEVFDVRGVVLGSTRPGEVGGNYGNRPEVKGALNGLPSTQSRDVSGREVYYVAVPTRHGFTVTGAVRLGYLQSTFDSEANSQFWTFLLTGMLTLLAAVIAAILMAGAYTRRLRGMHAATEQLAAGDLSTRILEIPRGAWELRGLERSFNDMAGRLQASLEAQRSFASDASHQLRTPLTALRLRLENAAAAAEQDPSTAATALEAAITDVQRLQVLVDGLLALTRLEAQASALSEVDVDEVMRGRLLLWQPLADERGVRLLANVQPRLRVLAAVGALDQVLDSYLDNALEVAPRGSTIKVMASAEDDHVVFHVVDSGPGMEPAARARAFDRFWRQRTDRTGTGLGLAIAARLAEVSGGSVRLDAASPHGIDAVLLLQPAGSSR